MTHYPNSQNMARYLDALTCFLVHDDERVRRSANAIRVRLSELQAKELTGVDVSKKVTRS